MCGSLCGEVRGRMAAGRQRCQLARDEKATVPGDRSKNTWRAFPRWIIRQRRQALIVRSRKRDQGNDRPDERHEHIPLTIPDIPLGSQELTGRLPQGERDPPLDQFIEGAECQANANNQERQPSAAPEGRAAFQNFPDQQGRHETLGEMTKPVVVVARQIE